MLEQHVSAQITRKRLNAGPAAKHVGDFSDWLHARGYKRRTVPDALIASLQGSP
jgi:hypothetical protein